MKASQYLYTSWKNAPNFGFSLYSKSPDVTNEEDTAISHMMKYRAPKGLPYEPTEEEIEKLFPRGFGFFRLPTGRYCIAQSCYIGHEYKGFDDAGRMGNFLIHAYIFDQNPLVRAATFINSDLFRRDLTLDEWRAVNPPPLAVKEIPESLKIDERAVSAFISEESRKKVLKSLVQTAINNLSDTPIPIYLNDTLDNLTLWYNALEMCLPAEAASRTTFTYFAMDDCPRLAPELRPSILNAREDGMIAIDYRQKMLSGAVVFDLAKNVLSEVPYGKYANEIVELFAQNSAAAMQNAALVNDISVKTGAKIDDAYAISQALEKNFGYFQTLNDLMTAFRGAVAYHSSQNARLSDSLCIYLLRGKYSREEAKDVFSSLYPFLSAENRDALTAYYADNFTAGEDLNAYVDSFKRQTPFSIQDYVRYCFRVYQGGAGYFNRFSGDFRKIGLLYAGICENFQELSSTIGAQELNGYLYYVLRSYAAAGDKQNTGILFSQLSKYGFSVEPFLADVIGVILSQGYTNLDLTWFFDLLKGLFANPEKAAGFCKEVILNYPGKQELVEKYCRYAGENSQFARTDELLRKMQPLEPFFIELDRYQLTLKPMGQDELVQYYRQYFVTGLDQEGLFFRFFRKYLDGLNQNSRPKEVSALYYRISTIQQPGIELLREFVKYGFVDLPLQALEEALIDPACKNNYEALAQTALQSGIDIPQYMAVKQAQVMPCKTYDLKKPRNVGDFEKIEEIILRGELYVRLNSDRAFEIFADHYLIRTAILADGLLKRQWELSQVMNEVLLPFKDIRDFMQKLDASAEKAGMEKAEFLASILIFAVTRKEASASIFANLIERYLDSLKKQRDCRLIFKAAIEMSDQSEQPLVQKYVDAYNASHKGSFFSNLFKKK